jgi:hypothetical protein
VEQSYSIQPSAQIAALRKSVEAWLQAASTQAIAAGRRDLSDRCELELVQLGWPTPATLGAVGLEKVGKSSLINALMKESVSPCKTSYVHYNPNTRNCMRSRPRQTELLRNERD